MPRRKPQKQPPAEFVKELSEWLGRAFIAATTMEHLLGVTIADMMKVNRMQHRAFIIPMSFASKVSLLRQLGREFLTPADRKSLNRHLKEFEDCAERRNSLAHGLYGTKRGKFALVTFSGEGRFSGQAVAWHPSDLRNFVARIEAANRTFYHVRQMFPQRLKLPPGRKVASPLP
ncbi:hypothetical protein [Bradyrhizobium sp. BRP56]|uniref:hypothetical protein n=1 Tax=Bradyrhizobium sp. BRP56 TaxID=2793819 RepID=UPI001CD438B8|nr:hypothetical protein [Bradyrhizobium sp. BRP56]MCA1400062.1 hypothetical protein [Bradyrhizobium sp. BRP56]